MAAPIGNLRCDDADERSGVYQETITIVSEKHEKQHVLIIIIIIICVLKKRICGFFALWMLAALIKFNWVVLWVKESDKQVQGLYWLQAGWV